MDADYSLSLNVQPVEIVYDEVSLLSLLQLLMLLLLFLLLLLWLGGWTCNLVSFAPSLLSFFDSVSSLPITGHDGPNKLIVVELL